MKTIMNNCMDGVQDNIKNDDQNILFDSDLQLVIKKVMLNVFKVSISDPYKTLYKLKIILFRQITLQTLAQGD